VNVAVTDSAEFIETVQTLGFVPVQAPLQLANTDPLAGTAVSEMAAPGKYRAAQVPPELTQLMALSALDTVPLPLPASATLSCSPRTKFAVRVESVFMVNWHAPVPVQGPLQPAKRELEPGVAVAATWLPLWYAAEQVEPQSMPPLKPAGVDTVPEPFPVVVTLSV
jgi:hypothetical protein